MAGTIFIEPNDTIYWVKMNSPDARRLQDYNYNFIINQTCAKKAYLRKGKFTWRFFVCAKVRR
jgi:hypothetical protein